MKPINIIGSIVGIALTILSINSLKPSSDLAFAVFAVWSCSPFILTFVLSITHKNIIGVTVAIYLSLLVGLLLFLEITYWHQDPQGGIAILMLPFVLFAVIMGSTSLIKEKNT
ncbi:hypothetical protein [Sulfuriflexus mobilis]|uniref:hypothetical protein n=1 Tax=Sulfuriflexus mobilis TaxID=1811807 RepID=UPI000F8338A6|nr:hypothetical protein [Sulfuriflexus mobilis]